MKAVLHLLVLVSLAVPVVLSAQTSPARMPSPPLPAGPVLDRAPAFSKWTVTYQFSSPAKANSRRLRSLEITKTNDIYRQVFSFGGGKMYETWHVGSAQFSISRDGKVTMYDRSSFGESRSGAIYNPTIYTDYSASDFPDLNWISPKNYVGMEPSGDTQLLVFQQGTDVGVGAKAFLDAQTRLPARVVIGPLTLLYKFSALPYVEQALPPPIDTYLQKRAALFRKAMIPVPSN